MSKSDLVEISLVFRGKDSRKNSEAFMLHMDTMQGIGWLAEGIRHFGGSITHIRDDPEQNLIILDGDMSDE